MIRLPFLVVTFLACQSSLPHPLHAAPNIILILSDDQGWNNTSTRMMPGRPDSKSDFYLTPHIDRLAQRGMTFSQAYAPLSTPNPFQGVITELTLTTTE